MKQIYAFAMALLFLLASNSIFAQPVAVCHNGLSIDILPQDCSIELWAIDFDAASFSTNSQIVDLKVNRVFDLNNNGIIDPNELLDKPPATDTVVFVFDDINKIQYVQLWVIDDNGDFDSCVTFVDFSNVLCPFERLDISGKIESPTGVEIRNLTLNFEIEQGILNTVSSSSLGRYYLNHVVYIGRDFKVMPMSEDEPLKGIGYEDLKAIADHILNNVTFQTPYEFIAADVNNDGKISTIDIQILRKSIENPSIGFPNKKPWRFVPKNYNFNFNPNAPSMPQNFPEFLWLNNVTSYIDDADFIAIKIGDVAP